MEMSEEILKMLSEYPQQPRTQAQSASQLFWVPGFPGGTAVKNPPANAGDRSGRSPGGGNCNHSSILAWIIP